MLHRSAQWVEALRHLPLLLIRRFIKKQALTMWTHLLLQQGEDVLGVAVLQVLLGVDLPQRRLVWVFLNIRELYCCFHSCGEKSKHLVIWKVAVAVRTQPGQLSSLTEGMKTGSLSPLSPGSDVTVIVKLVGSSERTRHMCPSNLQSKAQHQHDSKVN